MCKKSLLMMLLMALLVPWAVKAQTTVTIGNGTATSNTNPIGTYYNYSIAEQLYTAEEIGTAGTISSISFYYMGIAAKNLPITVYMKHVDEENLASAGITLADADEVFSGTLSVTTTAGWVTINLATPFAYDGSSNLLIGFIKDYLYYFSGQSWQGTAMEATMARYTQSDNAGPYTTSTVPGTEQATRPNIQIVITPSSGPVCEKPESIEASNVGTNSATLTWTGGSGNYNVEYRLASETEWTSYLTNTTLTTTTLSGLNPGKAYQARVQSVCGSDVSGWKTSANFSTACDVITTFPWAEDFESYAAGDFVDPCWVNEHIEGDGTKIFKIYTSTTSGNSTHQLQLPDQSSGTMTKLVLPEMNLPENYEFSIDVYRSNSTYSPANNPYEGIRVYASTNGEIEGATELAFIPRQFDEANGSIPAEAAAAWYTYELPIGMSGNCYIILRGENRYCTATYMDNFIVKEVPACAKPTSLAVVNNSVTAHGATISWTSDASAWQIQLGEATPIDVTEPTYTFTGLTPETAFSVKVRANCDGVYSEWTAPVNFTTAIACPAPTGLTTSNLTGHSVTLTWTAVEGAMYESSVVKTAEYNANNIEWGRPFEGNTVTLSDLDPETGYTFALRKDCTDAEDGYSQIVTRTFTTTAACPAPTGLAATLTPGNGNVATLSWTSDASAWVIAYKTADETDFTEIAVTENPYTFDRLEAETTYTAKVKANCGDEDGESQWSSVISFTPTDAYMLTVNDGTTTNGYVPIYGTWVDDITKSQFIIPAENLTDMAWGTINKMTFYGTNTGSNPTWGAAQFEVYITETNETTLSALADYGTMTKVMNSAHLQIDGNQMVVQFDTPYSYMGGNLMIGFLQTVSGSWSGCSWYGVSAEGASMGGYGNSISQQNFLPKTTFDYIPGEEPDCLKPTGLAVNYEGGITATVTWNGEATSYNIEVNGTVTEGVTSPYTLEGLELATTYAVKVQANCGDNGVSDWAGPVSFTTDLCMPENMCEITIELTDAYGDGGGQIQVVDNLTEEVLGTYTNSSASTTYTLNVCDGRVLNFIFAATDNWPYENGWVITDINDEIISEHEGCSSSGSCDAPENGIFATYTVSCTVTTCKRPTDLATSEVGSRSAVLSWTENGEATEWIVAYGTDGVDFREDRANANPFTLGGLVPETEYTVKVRPVCDVDDKWSDAITFTTDVACPKPYDVNVTPYPFTANVEWNGFAEAYEIEWAEVPATRDPYAEEGWYYYDNGTYEGPVGLGGGEFHWGIMLPAGSFEGTTIDVVKAYDINAMVGTLAIYNDGTTAPANQLSIQDMEFTGAGAWVEFNTGGVIVDPTKNVWIVFDAVDGAAYPMGVSSDDNGDANGRWVEISGTWYDMATVGVTERANMIRAHFVNINYDELDWTTVSGVTSPYTIEDLEAETDYIVRVKALCGGEDGESNWTIKFFTTPSACDAPINLEATDITYNAATLNWTGYQESYNVQYRTAGGLYPAQNAFFEDFESASLETNGWTVIRNGEGTEYTDWRIYDGSFGGSSIEPHSGEYVVMGRSWNNSAYDVDNWLITPQVSLAGELKYWVIDDGSYHEHYDIYVSTTTADISAFTLLYEPGDASNEWTEHIVDLSSYNGAQGYIAFRLTDNDQDYLMIDDVLIGEMVLVPAGEWITATTTEPTLAITGLTHDTDYEWQVQGINAGCDGGLTEWSEIASFTAAPLPTQTIALTAGWNYVSFNKEITLNELKAALVEAVPGTTITIQSKTDNTSYNPARNRWTGSLTWNLNQMYLIQVNADCEIALQAFPVIPSEHPITVLGGGQYTYIAFPLDESMSLTNAFAGFAVNDDVIQSKDGNSQYKRGRWMGNSLTNLEPGSGYIYQSGASTADRILVFPAVNSKATVAPTAPKKAASLTPVKFPNTITLDLNLRK